MEKLILSIHHSFLPKDVEIPFVKKSIQEYCGEVIGIKPEIDIQIQENSLNYFTINDKAILLPSLEIRLFKILKNQPQCLLEALWPDFLKALNQVENTKKQLTRLASNDVYTMFETLLGQGVYLHRHDLISNVIYSCGDEATVTDIMEELLSKMGNSYIQILIHTSLLEDFYYHIETIRVGYWEEFQKQFFFEYGIKLPFIELGVTPEIQVGEYQIKLNDYKSSPEKFTTFEAVKESIYRELNGRKAWSINRVYVNTEVEEFGILFPNTVKMLWKKINPSALTQICRRLLEEEIPIRDFNLIFESILCFDYIVVDDAQQIVLGDYIPLKQEIHTEFERLEAMVSFIRWRLQKIITWRLQKNLGTPLGVYQLPQELESLLYRTMFTQKFSHQKGHALELDEINTHFKKLLIEDNAVVLTYSSIRAFVWKILKPFYPHIQVLSYLELDPKVNLYDL